MPTKVAYVVTACRSQAFSIDRDNPDAEHACAACPIQRATLRASDGWDLDLDDRSGMVTCSRDGLPTVHLPPHCYACAWESEP